MEKLEENQNDEVPLLREQQINNPSEQEEGERRLREVQIEEDSNALELNSEASASRLEEGQQENQSQANLSGQEQSSNSTFIVNGRSRFYISFFSYLFR